MFNFHFMDINSVSSYKETELYRNKSNETLSYLQNLLTTLPLFKALDNDFSLIQNKAQHFKKFDDVIILGTGGSSLGGQALTALSTSASPRLHFLDNIDSYTFFKTLQNINKEKTGVIAISKSGNTPETLMQLMTCLNDWPEDFIKNNFLIISEAKDNAIRQISNHYTIDCLDHPDDIGGRFTIFTLVGLLPAFIANIDVPCFIQGAKKILEDLKSVLQVSDCLPVKGALLQTILQLQGVNQSIIFVYCDRLKLLGDWYAQLWGESLGKKDASGKAWGTTPIRAVGTVDQHSQLQLYLDGPRDKYFTFITLDNQNLSKPLQGSKNLKHPALDILKGKTMDDLIVAEQRATIDTMRSEGCYLRQINLNQVNVFELGALMMHFIVETLAAAHLQNINPFDQPAVELSKKLTIEYLKKNREFFLQ